jgi:hypothetical protein
MVLTSAVTCAAAKAMAIKATVNISILLVMEFIFVSFEFGLFAAMGVLCLVSN